MYALSLKFRPHLRSIVGTLRYISPEGHRSSREYVNVWVEIRSIRCCGEGHVRGSLLRSVSEGSRDTNPERPQSYLICWSYFASIKSFWEADGPYDLGLDLVGVSVPLSSLYFVCISVLLALSICRGVRSVPYI